MVFQITAKLNTVRGPHTQTVLHRPWWNVALIAVSRDLSSSSSSLSLSLPKSSRRYITRSKAEVSDGTVRVVSKLAQSLVPWTTRWTSPAQAVRRLMIWRRRDLFTGASSPSRATCPYSQWRRTQRMRQWSLHGRSFAGLRHYELGDASGFRNCPI